jgi:hypothetical protein
MQSQSVSKRPATQPTKTLGITDVIIFGPGSFLAGRSGGSAPQLLALSNPEASFVAPKQHTNFNLELYWVLLAILTRRTFD